MLSLLTSFLILTFLEIVLGIDNLVFISILTSRLPEQDKRRAWRWGLTGAWVTRLLLLGSVVWLTRLQEPFITVYEFGLSVRDLILLAGGIFLIHKAVQEIKQEINPPANAKEVRAKQSFPLLIMQIAVLDIVFSLDSVITAVALTDQFWVMAAAITVAILVMVLLSKPISYFIEHNPAIKMLAYCLLILIGGVLVADGMHIHVPRGYIYSAIVFSLFVETVNHYARIRKQGDN